MKKVLFLGSQHGNELLGEKLYKYIQQHRKELLPHVSYLLGNPEAYRQGVRYVESDLNRSYNGKYVTYEERRAAEILVYIKKHEPDLVLDLHTTTTDKNPPCIITASPDHEFVRYSSICKIVHMNHEIVNNSLIGNCPEAISIEIHENEINNAFLSKSCDDIQRYLNQKPRTGTKHVFEVKELLKKSDISEVEAAELKNFKLSKQGFYPILVGENSYKKQTDYLGFKAYKTYELRYT